MAVVEEEQRRSGGARVRAEEEERWRALKRTEKTVDGSVEELRSDFQRLAGRAPRLTGHTIEASGQSLVRSKRDRTCSLRGDRTRTESGQKTTREQLRVTGHAYEVQNRTQWSQRRVQSSVRSEVHENHLRANRHAGDVRNRT
jgi:hypothetical protein